MEKDLLLMSEMSPGHAAMLSHPTSVSKPASKKRLLSHVIAVPGGFASAPDRVGSRQRADEVQLLAGHRLSGGQRSGQAEVFPFLQERAFLNQLGERNVADLLGGPLQGSQEMGWQRARRRLQSTGVRGNTSQHEPLSPAPPAHARCSVSRAVKSGSRPRVVAAPRG
jgi:hypothetical protein